MTTKGEFYKALGEWEIFSRKLIHFSNPYNYRKCAAYEELRKMGTEISPYLREIYKNEDGHEEGMILTGFPFLIRDIAGEVYDPPVLYDGGFSKVDVEKMKKYTVGWLDNYLSHKCDIHSPS